MAFDLSKTKRKRAPYSTGAPKITPLPSPEDLMARRKAKERSESRGNTPVIDGTVPGDEAMQRRLSAFLAAQPKAAGSPPPRSVRAPGVPERPPTPANEVTAGPMTLTIINDDKAYLALGTGTTRVIAPVTRTGLETLLAGWESVASKNPAADGEADST